MTSEVTASKKMFGSVGSKAPYIRRHNPLALATRFVAPNSCNALGEAVVLVGDIDVLIAQAYIGYALGLQPKPFCLFAVADGVLDVHAVAAYIRFPLST